MKTVSNVIIHIKSTSIFGVCAVCNMPIIHIIKSWILRFTIIMLLICWMDLTKSERSICTCTLARIACLSPSHSKQNQKRKRERSRVESERCLHGVYLYYFYNFLLFDWSEKQLQNYETTTVTGTVAHSLALALFLSLSLCSMRCYVRAWCSRCVCVLVRCLYVCTFVSMVVIYVYW